MPVLTPTYIAKAKAILFKIFPFIKKRLKNKYWLFRYNKEYGAAPLSNDETSIYFHALSDLEDSQHSDIVNVFLVASVKATFLQSKKNEKGKIEDVVLDILATVAAKEKFAFISTANINWDATVARLWDLYDQKTREAASPVEALQLRTMSSISSDLKAPNEALDLSSFITGYADMRRLNRHRAAIELLTKFKDEHWGRLSKENRYKLILNIAITYHELRENQLAAQYFLELLDLRLYIEDTYGYVALAYALMGDQAQAITYAHRCIQISPNNLNAYLAKIVVRQEPLTVNFIRSLVPAALLNDSSIQVNMALAMGKEGLCHEEIRLLTQIEDQHPEPGILRLEVLNHLGAAYMQSLGLNHLAPPFVISNEDRDTLLKAKSKLSEAWQSVAHTDLEVSRAYILANLGVANMMLGYNDDAVRDLTIAVNLSPDQQSFINLWLLSKNDSQKKRAIIQQMESLPPTEELKVRILLFTTELFEEHEEVARLMDDATLLFEEVEKDASRRIVTDCIVEHLFKLERLDDADKKIDWFIEQWPDDPVGYFSKAKISLIGKDDEAVKQWVKASISKTGTEEREEVLERAMQILMRIKDYETIIDTLGQFSINRYSPVVKFLLMAYTETGNHVEAYRMANAWRSLYPENPIFAEITGTILLRDGNFPQAIKIYNEFLEGQPKDQIIRAKLGTTYYVSFDFEQAVKEFDQLTDTKQLPLEVSFQIADAYCKAGQVIKGFELAYQIRAGNYQELAAHEHYVTILTGIYYGQAKAETPEVGAVDTALKIEGDDGQTSNFVLTDRPNPRVHQEIASDSVTAKALFGKKVGDLTTIGRMNYTITAILSKYTFAYQDSIDQLGTRFANQGAIKVGKFKPGANPVDAIKELASFVDSQSEELIVTPEPASTLPLTLFMKATQSGISLISYLYDLTSPASDGLQSFLTMNEVVSAHDRLTNSELPLLLDLTALLAMYSIQCLDDLAALGKQLLVTGSAVHMLKGEILQQKNMLAKFADPTYGKLEQTATFAEKVARRISDLEALILWIKVNTQVVYPSLSPNFLEEVKFDHIIGKAYNDIRRIGQEQTILAVTDDVVFRLMCSQEMIAGASTFILVLYFKEKNLITGGEILAYFKKLISLHYLGVPLNVPLMMELIDEAGYVVQYPFDHACSYIHPFFTNDEHACTLVVQFLYRIYQVVILPATRGFIAQFLFSTLFKFRDRRYILSILVPMLNFRFYLLEQQRQELIAILTRI